MLAAEGVPPPGYLFRKIFYRKEIGWGYLAKVVQTNRLLAK